MLRRAFARETTSSPEMYAAAARNWGEPGRLRRVFAKLLRGTIQAELMACKGLSVCGYPAKGFAACISAGSIERVSERGTQGALTKSSQMSAGICMSDQYACMKGGGCIAERFLSARQGDHVVAMGGTAPTGKGRV